MKIQLVTYLILFGILFSGCKLEKNNQGVLFPEVSDPIAITSGPNEHLFASYYGINSWSADQKYVTVLQTPIKYRLPTENDPATLGLVDMQTESVLPLGRFHHSPRFRDQGKAAACDLHPRWSPNSDMIGFNSVTTGSRQVYIIKLN